MTVLYYCALSDLFVEAWNLCASVIVNCFDIRNSEVLSILDIDNSSWYQNMTVSMAVLSKNATGDEHKKLEISWKSLTNFLNLVN